MAPECGPWAGWNRLNLFTSPESIQQKQFEQLPHVRLCSRICQYQVPLKRHVHLEQPIGSNTFTCPSLSRFPRWPFVLCSICVNLAFVCPIQRISYGRAACTTSMKFFQTLNNHKCKGQREYQRIEGSMNIQGKFRRVSQFCATYEGLLIELPDWFVLDLIILWDQSNAFVNHDPEDERPSKRFWFFQDLNKRFRVSKILMGVKSKTLINP